MKDVRLLIYAKEKKVLDDPNFLEFVNSSRNLKHSRTPAKGDTWKIRGIPISIPSKAPLHIGAIALEYLHTLIISEDDLPEWPIKSRKKTITKSVSIFGGGDGGSNI